jgi:hypothetical protein
MNGADYVPHATSRVGSTVIARGRLRPNLPPPLQESQHLIMDELVEPARIFQPPPRRGVRAHCLDPLPQILLTPTGTRIQPGETVQSKRRFRGCETRPSRHRELSRLLVWGVRRLSQG